MKVYNLNVGDTVSYISQFHTFIKSIAHRGFSTIAPENTLPSYILAYKKGFHYVECDVAFTSDGVPVLLHDATINRTSNGTGDIATMTLSTVKSYDFGSWKSTVYKGTKIPTLKEFVVLCRNLGLHPYIEIKANTQYTDEQIHSIVDIVEKYGLRNNASIISFSYDYLTKVKDYNPYIRLGYVVSSITSSIITQTKALQTSTNEVFLDSSAYSSTEINLCDADNIPLEIWAIDSKATIKGLDDYISGVTSDNQHCGFIKCESILG